MKEIQELQCGLVNLLYPQYLFLTCSFSEMSWIVWLSRMCLVQVLRREPVPVATLQGGTNFCPPAGHWYLGRNSVGQKSGSSCFTGLFIFFFLVFVYFGDWERQSVSRGGQREREREGDTESEVASGSELSAHSLTQGSNSGAMRSWPELKSLA